MCAAGLHLPVFFFLRVWHNRLMSQGRFAARRFAAGAVQVVAIRHEVSPET